MLRRRGLLTGSAALCGVAAAGLARAQASPWVAGQRQDIATLPLGRVAMLDAAVGEMQRRSRNNPDDPAGWRANTMAHAVACSGRGALKVHGCWWFLPWHRAYLAVTEMKLQAVAGDASLRLPYWNWSNDRRIPAPYTRPGSALATAKRFTADRSLRATEVDCLAHDPALARLGVAALGAEAFEPADEAAIPLAFGGVAEAHPSGWRGRSRLEGVPHGALHNYVGGEAADGSVGDMTILSTASLDPVFFAHHANLDRLWSIWQTDPRHVATQPTRAEFQDKEFVFSWLDGLPIVLRVADVLEGGRFQPSYDQLAVSRDAMPLAADLGAASTPLAEETVALPPLRGGQRATLTVTGLAAPERPINVELAVAPARSPDAGTIVGAIAMGRRETPAAYPDTEWHFDVTAVVRSIGAGPALVRVHDLALGRGIDPPLFRYSAMQVNASSLTA